MIRNIVLSLTALAALGGCATQSKSPAASPVVRLEPPREGEAWLEVASPEDLDRIRRLPDAWSSALSEARKSSAAEIRQEGDLLKPQAALARPALTPGSYNCRLVRLGRYTGKTRAFEKFKPFFCYVEVEGDLLTIVKQTGSERPAGRLWNDQNESRLIFLGSMALGSEDQPMAYGENRGRDMAGVVERIAPFRWRLVIPWPRAQSKLDVFELTPVPEQPAAG